MFDIDYNKTYTKISKYASSLIGTSAFLQEGDKVLVKDLFYGMMLPSGNDAAYSLAEFYGSHLRLAYSYGTYNKNMLVNDYDLKR